MLTPRRAGRRAKLSSSARTPLGLGFGAKPGSLALRALLAATVLLALAPAAAVVAAGKRDFPRDFLWGTAISGFQTEAGGEPSRADRGSDWWVWSHDQGNIDAGRVSGDRVEEGPGHWRLYRRDARLAADRLGANAYRFSLEWSRLFPRSTAKARTPRELDRLVDQRAARHYEAELRRARRLGMTPMVTLNHFTLPSWLHDPLAVNAALAGIGPDEPVPHVERGGWLNRRTVREYRKFAAWASWRYGDQVRLWVTLNEPMVVAVNGYVNVPGVIAGWFPPGAFTIAGTVRVVRNLVRANAAGYDAVHRHDRRAEVGPVHNMVAFTPSDPGSATDVEAAEHADYIFNRLFLNAAVRGIEDADIDGEIEPGERRPELRGADFVGLNYYFRSRVTGLGAPVSDRIPLYDFIATNSYSTPHNPGAPPCPTTCTEFGWEIYPQGFRRVLATAGSYELPVYVTENGIADADDDERAAYLRSHLAALAAAIRAGVVDARGYLAWTLVDNFEWSSGYYPRFGFFSYDPETLRRQERPSARDFRKIARGGRL